MPRIDDSDDVPDTELEGTADVAQPPGCDDVEVGDGSTVVEGEAGGNRRLSREMEDGGTAGLPDEGADEAAVRATRSGTEPKEDKAAAESEETSREEAESSSTGNGWRELEVKAKGKQSERKTEMDIRRRARAVDRCGEPSRGRLAGRVMGRSSEQGIAQK
ncbi:hypothetical protein OF83DRAFT_1083443 [Amylostereum chailletii]|nr:hypothetical protein OF83DRAFT_1083443 [Amylostereum chailletii]